MNLKLLIIDKYRDGKEDLRGRHLRKILDKIDFVTYDYHPQICRMDNADDCNLWKAINNGIQNWKVLL